MFLCGPTPLPYPYPAEIVHVINLTHLDGSLIDTFVKFRPLTFGCVRARPVYKTHRNNVTQFSNFVARVTAFLQ